MSHPDLVQQRAWRLGLACLGLAACQTKLVTWRDAGPAPPPPEIRPDCTAGPGWLPGTPPVEMQEPSPHPAPECPFYRAGFQNFLIATQPDPATGEPALSTYATVDDVFQKTVALPAGALAPAGAHRGTALRAWLGNVKQAGGRQILIDQDGHALYYGIHVNQSFVDFVEAHGLRTRQDVLDADPNLTFPPGIVTMQSTWKDIDPADGVAGDYSRYITSTAWVSRLRQNPATRLVSEDANAPRQIKVALVALHIAFSLPGYPALIWTTFEHAGASGEPDLAPVAEHRPSDDDPLNQASGEIGGSAPFLLYHPRTTFNLGNRPFTDDGMQLDEAAQSFPQRTSVYRVFPGSRSHRDSIDPEVVTLNQSVAALFVSNAVALSPTDKRGNYRLVGGIWLEKSAYFGLDSSLQNDSSNPFLQPGADGGSGGPVSLAEYIPDIQLNGTDSRWSILGGQDRLTGVATESFVQAPGSFNNCLTCHNTQSTTVNGIPLDRDFSPPAVKLLDPKRIAVSHVFSTFLLDEYVAGMGAAR